MTRHRFPRLLAVLGGLAVASVALSGCLFSYIPDATSAPSRTERPPASTDGIAEDLVSYYTQTLDWDDCGDGFDCTTVTAPLDWANPATGDISLAVVRHRATDGQPIGSLLTNPGGPGASGVDLVKQSLTFAVGDRLPESYDVIGFDPRGVGASTAVTCYDASDMDAYLFDIPAGKRHSAEWTDAINARNTSFAEACDENSDGILPYITTEQSARDMDLLRGVLGDEKLNYLGYSYGTYLGATYAGLFPDRAGRLVLDGALDPSVGELDVSTTQGVGFESALRAYMADCLDGSDCPFSGTVDDGMADLGALLAKADRSPLEASDGRMLGADALVTAIVAALYSQDSWSYLSSALTDVGRGDADTAFQLVDFYYNRSGGQYLDNSTEAFTAYNCMDYPDDSTPDAIAAAEATLAEKAPTIAPYWSSDIDSCASWPYPPTGKREAITAEGAPPIVVIGTTNDPATPYEWSVALADQLSSGVLITRVGEGHTGYNKGNSCVDDAVDAYLLDGTAPKDDLRCE